MVRITTTIIAAALFTSAPLLGAAQQPPPPEGAPIQGNPYGESDGSSTTSNAVNKPLLAKAKNWFVALQRGSVDRSQMESGPNTNANEATISNAPGLIAGLGPPATFTQQSTGKHGNLTYGIYLATFHNGNKVYFLFVVDDQGKVASLGLGTPR